MRRFMFAGVLLAVLVALSVAFATCNPPRDPDIVPAEKGTNVVTIQTANPYRFDVRLEVKCDWDGQNRYRFHQFIVVPGKKQTIIRVPNTLKFCEIWPKVLW